VRLELNCNIKFISILTHQAVPRLRQLVAGLSARSLVFYPRPVRMSFVVDKRSKTNAFCPSTSVFFRQYHSTNCPCCSYQKDKWAKFGDLPKSKALWVIGEHWTEKYFHSFRALCTLYILSNLFLCTLYILSSPSIDSPVHAIKPECTASCSVYTAWKRG